MGDRSATLHMKSDDVVSPTPVQTMRVVSPPSPRETFDRTPRSLAANERTRDDDAVEPRRAARETRPRASDGARVDRGPLPHLFVADLAPGSYSQTSRSPPHPLRSAARQKHTRAIDPPRPPNTPRARSMPPPKVELSRASPWMGISARAPPPRRRTHRYELRLALALLRERRAGAASKLSGYLAELPPVM